MVDRNDAASMDDNSTLSSCSAERLEEVERDVINALTEKRRQIDVEIEEFREKKEQEFRDFEAYLRNRRRLKAPPGDHLRQKEDPRHSHATPISIGQAAPLQNGQTLPQQGNLKGDSQVTLGLPSPSPSPSDLPSTTVQSEKPVGSTSGSATPPAYERDREFHGLFTPAYLRLLDSKHGSPKQSTSDTLQYASGSSRLSPEELKSRPSSSFSKRNSLSLCREKSISPTMKASTSLPSALRRTSSDQRPKSPKHVTFRLSDFTVVEPSSSYEELPTPPDLPSGERQIAAELTAADSRPPQSKSSAQQHSMPRKKPTPPGSTTEPDAEEEGSMFALDEDLEMADNTMVGSQGQCQLEPEDEVPDLDLENDRYTGRELTSGSPAAGSLPISIIRPSPKGLEGGMYGGSRG